MTLSIARDAFILFLLIYAVLDLSNQLIHHTITRLFSSEKENQCTLLIPLSSLLPSCAEYQIRKAEKLASSLVLITDHCNPDTLRIANCIAKESDSICLMRADELSLSKVQGVSSVYNEAADQDPSKHPVLPVPPLEH